MKTATLTVDGAPIVSQYQVRKMRRRAADVEIHEAKREHRLTINALWGAIAALKCGDCSEDTLKFLTDAACRAEAFTQ